MEIVAAVFFALMCLLCLGALLRPGREATCICPDADDCTCGGAWGGRK